MLKSSSLVIVWFSSKNVSGGFGPSTKMAPTAELSLTKSSCLEPVAQLEPNFDNNKTALWPPSWSEGGITRHNFGRGPSNDYFIKILFLLSNWFQTRLEDCYVNLLHSCT
jgi:hypothetical protein